MVHVCYFFDTCVNNATESTGLSKVSAGNLFNFFEPLKNNIIFYVVLDEFQTLTVHTITIKMWV
jgi:hypothetical protein